MQLEPCVPPCVIFSWCLVSGVSGGSEGWYCYSSYGVASPFSSFSPFPNSSIGAPMLRLVVGQQCAIICICISKEGFGRTSQETATLNCCQQALLGISNSDWVWWLHIGWISRCLWMAFPSGYAPIFVPIFPLDSSSSGLKSLRRVGGPILQVGNVSILFIWFLQVLSPLCRVFQLMSFPLCTGSILLSWNLGLSDGYFCSPSPIATHLCSISWSSLHLLYILSHLILTLFTSPPPPFPQSPPSNSSDYFVPLSK